MSWTGALCRSPAGEFTSFCAQHSSFASHLASITDEAWHVVFAVNGPDQAQVQSILNGVTRAAQCIRGPIADVSGEPEEAGGAYVYAYFAREPAAWSDCFYIGKGTARPEPRERGRWTDHIDPALKTAAQAQTAKMRHIRAWIESAGLEGEKSAVIRRHAAGRLVRKVCSFKGPHAHAQAFYVEYFLITHAVGAHSVANDTNGNARSGECFAIARPGGFTRTAVEERIWAGTVACFAASPQSPSLRSKWQPAALTALAAPYLDRLDAHARRLGLEPYPMANQGRLDEVMMSRPHVQVAGASDAIFTYSRPGQHAYRIELRIGATEFLTSMSLRPFDTRRESHRTFKEFLRLGQVAPAQVGSVRSAPEIRHEHAVMAQDGWPYFKPYALDGVGRSSAWFSLLDPHLEVPVYANWIEGTCGRLSLVQGLELVTVAFAQGVHPVRL
jgi:hypothetical protein